jgi:hypothetical protein
MILRLLVTGRGRHGTRPPGVNLSMRSQPEIPRSLVTSTKPTINVSDPREESVVIERATHRSPTAAYKWNLLTHAMTKSRCNNDDVEIVKPYHMQG